MQYTKTYEYKATCIRVIDGDTLLLKIDLGFNISIAEKFRVFGIDTPEVYGVKKDSEEYNKGKKASERANELLFKDNISKDLIVRTFQDKKGKYGRYIADIFILEEDGKISNFASILISEGLAKKYDFS